VNFVHANASSATLQSARPSTSRSDRDRGGASASARHAEYGHVPAYLVERQAKAAAEAAAAKKAAEEAAMCPPGHRLLPEDERVQTLEGLKVGYQYTAMSASKLT
jgi:hypothetical protein